MTDVAPGRLDGGWAVPGVPPWHELRIAPPVTRPGPACLEAVDGTWLGQVNSWQVTTWRRALHDCEPLQDCSLHLGPSRESPGRDLPVRPCRRPRGPAPRRRADRRR